MDFNFGNLVSAAVGAVTQVVDAVIDFFSPAAEASESEESGGILGAIAGAAVDLAEAVLGAIPGTADVNGDGEIDAEEAEKIFNDVLKVMLGGMIVGFGYGSSDSDNHSNGEKMVISGNHVDPYLTRNFIEPAIKQIKDWKLKNNGDVTWCVVDSGYTDTDKTLIEDIAKGNNAKIIFLDDRSDLINYINTGKDKDGNTIKDRSVDKITDISIFSHGLRDHGGILALNYKEGGDLNISSNELENMNIDKDSFSNPHTYFGSCNSATVVDGTSFANEWVKKVGGEAEAISDPTPESEELGGQSSYYEINNQTLKFKIADKVRLMSGVNFRSEGADNYPKKYVDPDPQKADFYEDIHWVRIHEDGNIENIDIGGPRNEKNN